VERPFHLLEPGKMSGLLLLLWGEGLFLALSFRLEASLGRLQIMTNAHRAQDYLEELEVGAGEDSSEKKGAQWEVNQLQRRHVCPALRDCEGATEWEILERPEADTNPNRIAILEEV
jgi:hypothetical protein